MNRKLNMYVVTFGRIDIPRISHVEIHVKERNKFLAGERAKSILRAYFSLGKMSVIRVD